jgi:hypothetical protein
MISSWYKYKYKYKHKHKHKHKDKCMQSSRIQGVRPGCNESKIILAGRRVIT